MLSGDKRQLVKLCEESSLLSRPAPFNYILILMLQSQHLHIPVSLLYLHDLFIVILVMNIAKILLILRQAKNHKSTSPTHICITAHWHGYGTDSLLKSGWIKLILQNTSSLSEMMRSSKCLLHVSKSSKCLLHISKSSKCLLHVSKSSKCLLHVSTSSKSLLHARIIVHANHISILYKYTTDVSKNKFVYCMGVTIIGNVRAIPLYIERHVTRF